MDTHFNKYNESINLSYNNAVRMLFHLKNVIHTYEKMTNPDEMTTEVYRDSIIKKYEMLEDLLWKLLSKIFKSSGLEINNPRGCYKQAFTEKLITDVNVWNDILLSRNTTAHLYNEEDYNSIRDKIIGSYVGAIEELLNNIGQKVI